MGLGSVFGVDGEAADAVVQWCCCSRPADVAEASATYRRPGPTRAPAARRVALHRTMQLPLPRLALRRTSGRRCRSDSPVAETNILQ